MPLQQIDASMRRCRQYARRERSFDGVEYGLEVAPVNQDNYADFAEAIRAIFTFDRELGEFRKKWINEWLKENAAGMSMDSGLGDIAANSTEFASIMHNIINQMLLAIKADAAADAALKALENGEKPVIALSFTSESFIGDYAEEHGLKIDDTIDIDFRDVVSRYLERTLRITVTLDNDEKSTLHPLADLTGDLRSLYDEAAAAVKRADLADLPVSPIDWMRHRITKAGHSVAEITGRSTMIDYSGKERTLTARPAKEMHAAGKRVTIKKFNDGSLDAIILNKSGSTGVSLHASSKYKDQRRRRMVLTCRLHIDTHNAYAGRCTAPAR